MEINKKISDMPAFDNEMKEIVESFYIETDELLEQLDQDIIKLDRGNCDSELLNAIFRAVHTIKGTSSFLGFENMSNLAHRLEDILNKLRKGNLVIDAHKINIILESCDILKELLDQIKTKGNEKKDLSKILEKLKNICLEPDQAEQKPENELEINRSDDQKTNYVENLSAEKTEKKESSDSQKTMSSQEKRSESTISHSAKPIKLTDSTIRVDVTRLNNLMNLVSELVLGRNRLSQIVSQYDEKSGGLSLSKDLLNASSQIDFITTEIQMAVMKTRMIPIAKIFKKLPRLIRDLGIETGKDIDIKIFGEDTELDKTIIEELNDPLIHIIRNSADHGIELPNQRKSAGKKKKGMVTVRAEHEGNSIVISIEDDGQGINPEKLKKKALEKGLITKTRAEEISKRDILNLIFTPGFSTSAKVTNVSGRGVGMDVVRTNILKLKGLIDIESELGVGSKFIIKLPLTLAIIHAILVKTGEEIYAIPLDSVVEVIRMNPNDIETINGKEIIRFRNSVIPLIRIEDVLKSRRYEKNKDCLYVVIAGLAEKRLGIIVNFVLGQKEVVIKSMGDFLGKVPGIAGSTILGDGRVVMIVDLHEFVKLTNQSLKKIKTQKSKMELVEV